MDRYYVWAKHKQANAKFKTILFDIMFSFERDKTNMSSISIFFGISDN